MQSRVDAHLERPAALALAWILAVAVVATLVDHFWIPLDDGTLAQSAERVLRGELPHRDFVDPYTGFNAVVGAWAFEIFGVRLTSLRVPLVAGFALWLPAVWLVARRFAPAGAALAGTALAATLSVLTYPAAMPTWFGLFAATWGLWFLLRFLADGNRGWLVAVGLAGGVSVLFKVTGVYFVAAVLMVLVWARAEGGELGRLYAAVAVAGLGTFLMLLARMVLPATGGGGVGHFFLPAALLAVAAGARVRPTGHASSPALAALAMDGAVLAGGTLLPVAVFLLPYAASDAVGDWVRGVFVLPRTRFDSAASAPGDLVTLLPGFVAVGALAWSAQLSPGGRRRLAWVAALLVTALVAADDALDGGGFSALWYSARSWVPALTAWGAWAALRHRDAEVFAVVATAGLWALVQFPYAAPAYLFYVAPLAVLATLAVSGRTGRGVGPVLGVAAALYLFLGSGYVAGVVAAADTTLPGPRGGILVSAADAEMYAALDSAVAAGPTGALWVTPDAPEVYFLTGRANPTPILYEFLDPELLLPPDFAARAGVGTLVVNTRPLFSQPVDGAWLAARRAEGFRPAGTVGHFEILHRGTP